jgi:hypothetical protein|tara:strand:+ start:38 stop:460 length:423 start_codon:yes stop_codon:yes gene_type:complete
MDSKKADAIKKIVNSYLDLDVNWKGKKDELVKARAICYKILRDECCMSYNFIGKQFLKNHATVLHSYKEFPYMIKFDRGMERSYHSILSIWKEEEEEDIGLTPLVIKNHINNLVESNKRLSLSVISMEEKIKELQSKCQG